MYLVELPPKTMCSKFIPTKIKTIFGNLKLTVFSSMKFHLKNPICQNVQILLFLKNWDDFQKS